MTPRPMYMQIPVEEYESLKVAIDTMAAELEELRKHEVEWDLDKARVKELEAENESLKYSVATLDTDLTMLKRWHKMSEELPPDDFVLFCAFLKYDHEERGEWIVDFGFFDYDNHDASQIHDGRCWGSYNDWDEGQQVYRVDYWRPLPKPPKETK